MHRARPEVIPMPVTSNPWDTYAEAYAQALEQREPADQPGGMLLRMLDLLGDLNGKVALDAGCGPGVLAQVMAARGARVTGIDLSPRLIEMAREQDPGNTIDYRVGDLAVPHPDLVGTFDAIGSYLALNDVERYREFAATLRTLAKPGGRIALTFNNPYSSVVREHVTDYFDSSAKGTYLGMWKQGIKARYYHRTLEEYLDAFLATGLRLVKLVDVPDRMPMDTLSRGSTFPRFMIIAFARV
jgi:2-polyprenyl-3-methyl-5-hydroxy-6-metoxy-1,4-benzoquinol methylase